MVLLLVIDLAIDNYLNKEDFMNTLIKTLKLLWHNFIYFLILAIFYNFFCIGVFQYSLFQSYAVFSLFIFVTIIISILTYYFFIKTLKNKKNSIILLIVLLFSVVFCITPTPINQGLIPNIWGNKINFFFYDFSPTWVFVNQGLYLISYIYQHNLDKNKTIQINK